MKVCPCVDLRRATRHAGHSPILYIGRGASFTLQYLDQQAELTWHGMRLQLEFTIPQAEKLSSAAQAAEPSSVTAAPPSALPSPPPWWRSAADDDDDERAPLLCGAVLVRLVAGGRAGRRQC